MGLTGRLGAVEARREAVDKLGRREPRVVSPIGLRSVPDRVAEHILVDEAARTADRVGVVLRADGRRHRERVRRPGHVVQPLSKLRPGGVVGAGRDHVDAGVLELLERGDRLRERGRLRDLKHEVGAVFIGRHGQPVGPRVARPAIALRARERRRRLDEADLDARLAVARAGAAALRVRPCGGARVDARGGFGDTLEGGLGVDACGREETEAHVVLREDRGRGGAAAHHQEAVGVGLLGSVSGEPRRVAGPHEVCVRGAEGDGGRVHDLSLGGPVVNPHEAHRILLAADVDAAVLEVHPVGKHLHDTTHLLAVIVEGCARREREVATKGDEAVVAISARRAHRHHPRALGQGG